MCVGLIKTQLNTLWSKVVLWQKVNKCKRYWYVEACEFILSDQEFFLSLSVSSRFRLSSPAWSNVALRWGVYRRLWRPSGWTSGGWKTTCKLLENGFRKVNSTWIRSDDEQERVHLEDSSNVCTIFGLCPLTPSFQLRAIINSSCWMKSFWDESCQFYLIAQGGSDCPSDSPLSGFNTHSLCIMLLTKPLQFSSKPCALLDNHNSRKNATNLT